MEKSVRIALIGFLIVLAYVTIIFIDTRSFILPFPLFSYILFSVVLASALQNKLAIKVFIPLLIFLLFRCLGNPLTYTFFMEEAAYYEFTAGLTFTSFRILETFIVFPLIILTIGFKGVQTKVIAIALCSVYCLTLIPPFELLNYAFFTIMVLVMVYQKNSINSLPALLLLAIFDLVEGFSVLLLNG
jgi:hypothetical protein